MFERFTDRARRVLVIAQHEAENLNNKFIEPRHLLIGLVQGDGIAARTLDDLGVSLEELRAKVSEMGTPAKTPTAGSKVPFSPQAKKALELSLREALQLGHNYIGTEHLLLGTVKVLENEAVIALVGAEEDAIRGHVLQRLTKPFAPGSVHSPAVIDTMRLAGQLAGSKPMTTGHLLLALLSDTESQASKALGALGVTKSSFETELARVPLGETSDAPPRPQTIEIKLGDFTTTIGDPELASAFSDLSPDEIREALRSALSRRPEPKRTPRPRRPRNP